MAAGAGLGAVEARDAIWLQARWVRLEPHPEPRFPTGWNFYAEAEAKTLLEDLAAAKLAKAEPESVLRIEPGKTATLSFSPGKIDQNEPTASVTVTVGGVPQEFTARNVGVEIELSATEASGDEATLRVVTRRTRFLGFKEYDGGQTTDVGGADGASTKPQIPRGFFQPIFDTDVREHPLTLKPGRRAMLQFSWGPVTEEEKRKWGVIESPALAPMPARHAPAASDSSVLLVVGLK